MREDRKKTEGLSSITKNILQEKKVALFILSYNAEDYIRKTIERIPEFIRGKFVEIFVIDDSSVDKTLEEVLRAKKDFAISNLRVFKTPYNQGYGGNQKIGYTYAVRKNFDYVIMLHGDGQYPPEELPRIIEKLNDGSDALFGSRMMPRMKALKGGMPLYKWIGNQVLTWLENVILGTNFTEFHSGYRTFKVDVLKEIHFLRNSNDFHFDTDIIIQMIDAQKSIEEVSMPTHYGNETCHVNGIPYAWNCVASCIKYRICVLESSRNSSPSLPEEKENASNQKFFADFEKIYLKTIESENEILRRF